MDITKPIKLAYEKAKQRGWDRIYIWVDIHETVLKPTYKSNSDYVFYDDAKEALQYLSKIEFVKLGLYTCTKKEEIGRYLDFFKSNDIIFEHVNVNSEVQTTEYGEFNGDKPYFNVLIEDKAGFEPEIDWKVVIKFFKDKYGEL